MAGDTKKVRLNNQYVGDYMNIYHPPWQTIIPEYMYMSSFYDIIDEVIHADFS